MTNLTINSPNCQLFLFPQVRGAIIQRDPDLVAVICPVCGGRHVHGIGITPLRMSHCPGNDPIIYEIIIDDDSEEGQI